MTQDSSTAHPSTAVPPPPAIFETYLRVFHINDNSDDQVLFQAACRKGKVPFNWHVADSAEKGISYLKSLVEQSAHVPVCWPDLILLDLVMPYVSGFEVLKFIRATKALDHLPVAVLTGQIIPSYREESLRLGADLFLQKPADFHEAVQLALDLYLRVSNLKKTAPPRTPP